MFDTDNAGWEADFASVEAEWEMTRRAIQEAPEPHPGAVPPLVEHLPPSGELTLLLSTADIDRVTSEEKVRALRSHARLVAHHQARIFDAMMAICDDYRSLLTESEDDLVMDAAGAELRAALRLTRRSAQFELNLAYQLRERYPRVLEALRSGSIDLRRARVIVDETTHLDPGDAARVADTVLPTASQRTTGQLRAEIRRLCIEIDPSKAEKRYEDAIEERAVVAELTDVGTGTIVASDLPPDRTVEIMNRLTRIAQSLKTDDDIRTIDQLRADVFMDLLQGNATHTRSRGVVDIRLDLTTLAGLDQQAVELSGFGPVIADIGRQIAQQRSEWRYAVTDPRTGDIRHAGTTRRRPTARQRREVELRDLTCVFPGCRAPARSCDLDHRTPVSEGGATTTDELAAECRHDHVIRHAAGWRHVRNPDGTHAWTSPFGNVYTTARAP